MNSERTRPTTSGSLSKKQLKALTALLLAFAIVTFLAITGCDGQQTSGSNTSQATPSSSATEADDTSSGETAKLEAYVEDILDSGNAPEAGDLSSFPTRTDNEVAELGGDSLDIGLDDETKAPSAQTLLTVGGIQMQIPTSWSYTGSKDRWDLASKDGSVTGYINARAVSKPSVVDVEAMAYVVPEALHNGGADVVEVVNYEKRYSAISGELCSARIACAYSLKGVTYFCYAEYVVSKSYSNSIWLSGKANSFKKHLDELEQMTESIAFSPGEEL